MSARNFGQFFSQMQRGLSLVGRRVVFVLSLGSTAFLAGCGSIAFVATSRNLLPEEVGELGLVLDPRQDEVLSGGEVWALINGSTVITRSLSDPQAVQYGYFAADGRLWINAAPGRLVEALWHIDGTSVCYKHSSDEVCSNIHAADMQYGIWEQSAFYFVRRDNNVPTVMMVGVVNGNAIPQERL